MNLIQHLESHLGEIECGWGKDENWPFKVVGCEVRPVQGARTYSTLGLSNFEMCGPPDKARRQELLFMTRTSFGDQSIPRSFKDLGREVIARNHILLRGELVGPRGKMFDDTQLEALFVYSPIYLPDELKWSRLQLG